MVALVPAKQLLAEFYLDPLVVFWAAYLEKRNRYMFAQIVVTNKPTN